MILEEVKRCWKREAIRRKSKLKEVGEEELFISGHRGCAGCGNVITVRLALKASGKNVIVVSPTGCTEVISTLYPETSWKVPWIHANFENAGAVASGISDALKVLLRKGKIESKPKVIAIAGDGGTADIGLQSLSGAMERGHDLLYICVDNEAYMNTGVQRSGATPYGAYTTTSPLGQDTQKKDMPAIIAAHRIPYVATANISLPLDFIEKVKKAVSIEGASYIHVLAPCPTGWGFPSEKTIELGRLAADTGTWMLYEILNGEFRVTYRPTAKVPVKEYLKAQKRFAHLSEETIKKIQEDIDKKWAEVFR
jgi:pyruvate ferredoxin oxidoreductase beta subunit